MRAKQIFELLAKRFRNPATFKRASWIWGPPGVGKSAIVKMLAMSMGCELVDVRAVTLDSVDIRGVPYVINNGASTTTAWATPEFLPGVGCGPTIFFADEFAQAAVSVQSAFLQLFLDRRIGKYVLPDNVFLIAASNRQEDRAGTNRVISPLLNRFKHIEFEHSLPDFKDWAFNHGIDGRVMSYLDWKPDCLLNFDPVKSGKAFASPRSWEFASEELALDLDVGSLQESLSGILGPGVASEFVSFLEVWQKLPDPKSVLKDPENAAVYARPDMAIAMIGSLAECLKNDKGLADPYGRYVTRLSPEYAVLGIKNGCMAASSLMMTSKVQKFLQENRDLIL